MCGRLRRPHTPRPPIIEKIRIDVDRWLDELLKQERRPTLPPIVESLKERQDDLTDETLKVLEAMLGSSREIVPPHYHRTFEEKPFDACDFCAKPLLIPGTRYTVTKVYAGGQLSQELAICRFSLVVSRSAVPLPSARFR